MTARRLRTARLDLVTATAQHVLVALEDLAKGTSKLGGLLAADIPASWPPRELDEGALRYTLDALHRGPAQLGWWMRYVVLHHGPEGRPSLIGTVGLKGPPQHGTVELGYSIVDDQQRRGFATEAASALVDWAFEHDDVTEIFAQTLAELEPSIRVLHKLAFTPAAPREPETLCFTKSRAQWLAEGPAARRVPKLRIPAADEAIAGIPPVAREVFARLLAEPRLDDETLRAQIRGHVARIEAAAAANPYVDDALARDIARICEALLDAVQPGTPGHVRQQIQAASRYFVTEDDGDSDLAIGGLDEDAAIANAIAVHLGRADLVSALL